VDLNQEGAIEAASAWGKAQAAGGGVRFTRGRGDDRPGPGGGDRSGASAERVGQIAGADPVCPIMLKFPGVGGRIKKPPDTTYTITQAKEGRHADCCNHQSKRGVAGRTTTSINLAACLRPRAAPLLVDVDPQGHCAVGLAVPETNRPDDLRRSDRGAGRAAAEAGPGDLQTRQANFDPGAFEHQAGGVRSRCSRGGPDAKTGSCWPWRR